MNYEGLLLLPPMKKRKTYDTRVKYLVREGILPEKYKLDIHRSLISKWKREPPEKYTGYELNGDMIELYEMLRAFSENKYTFSVLRACCRIVKTLRDAVGEGENYVRNLREHKDAVVNAALTSGKIIGLRRAVKLFGLKRPTFRAWSLEVQARCGKSIQQLCNGAYPHQLTKTEFGKMRRLLADARFLHWPILSVAYYGFRKGIVKAHVNTWYKYIKLSGIERRRIQKIKKLYDIGLRATKPNEMWHADVTEVRTVSGQLCYIYLVIDNFSKYITSFRVWDKLCAKTRLETFRETWQLAKSMGYTGKTELIVDGGSENNNKLVENFVSQHAESLLKKVAFRDMLRSNSMAEAVNRVMKYSYLFWKPVYDIKDVTKVMRRAVLDYNVMRPHGGLKGLIPLEAYFGQTINKAGNHQLMKKAMKDRLQWNHNHTCQNCPVSCGTLLKIER